MGAKTLDQNLTPKKSHAQFPSHKIFHKALTDMTRKIETLVLNTPKNPHLNQAIQKNTFQNFPTKKIPKSKISNQKNSFDHPCHYKSGVSPLGRYVTI